MNDFQSMFWILDESLRLPLRQHVFHNLTGLIGGAVVEGEDLETDAGGREERAQGCGDRWGFVAGGDDDSEVWSCGSGGIG